MAKAWADHALLDDTLVTTLDDDFHVEASVAEPPMRARDVSGAALLMRLAKTVMLVAPVAGVLDVTRELG